MSRERLQLHALSDGVLYVIMSPVSCNEELFRMKNGNGVWSEIALKGFREPGRFHSRPRDDLYGDADKFDNDKFFGRSMIAGRVFARGLEDNSQQLNLRDRRKILFYVEQYPLQRKERCSQAMARTSAAAAAASRFLLQRCSAGGALLSRDSADLKM
ncbi:hypothetical protein EVAR_64781_1 [Eumeta japonica]|uniref:Uncharacterized protein n=1 Tax=Eumeta variegata TaxID=151549 RepID=A0A4C1ZST5_EUMVA|nr:hypothetical protein EVAR_64781_1 [Eumeta japonica]